MVQKTAVAFGSLNLNNSMPGKESSEKPIRETEEYLFLEAKVAEAKLMPHQSTGDFVFGRNEFGTLYFPGGMVTVGLCSGNREPLIYAIAIESDSATVLEIKVPSNVSEKRGQIVPPEAEILIHQDVPEGKRADFLEKMEK